MYNAIQRITDAAIRLISAFGPRLAALVGSLLTIVTRVIDSRPIHHGKDGQSGPRSLEDETRRQEERKKRLTELGKDPDHNGKVTNGSPREAEVALGLEEAGALTPPVVRPLGSGEGDFIDGDGQSWDVKGFQTRPGQKGDYDLGSAEKSIGRQIIEGRSVILDTKLLSEADKASLVALVRSRPDWAGKVLVY